MAILVIAVLTAGMTVYTCVLSDVALIARPLGAYIQGFIGEAYVCLVLYDCREYLCEV